MYTKMNLLAHKIASTYGLKESLRSVAFYGNRTVATDSCRLIEVSADGEAHEPRTLPAEVVKKCKLPKGTLKVDLEEIESITGIKANPHVEYPDIDIVLNGAEKNQDYTEISVNGRLLGELLLVMAQSNKFEHVKMRIPHSPNKAIYLYTQYGEQKMRGLQMPTNR